VPSQIRVFSPLALDQESSSESMGAGGGGYLTRQKHKKRSSAGAWRSDAFLLVWLQNTYQVPVLLSWGGGYVQICPGRYDTCLGTWYQSVFME
jgi:hypothetical protein